MPRVLALLLVLASAAHAQQNYVLCESPVTGAQQVFPGTSCPSGWIFVGVVQ
jgi:hypothetical protein